MSIRVKCFANLRQQLGVDSRDIAHQSGMTVGDVWRAISGQPPPANLLCARNFEYVEFTQPLTDGDEVAFFPPVTGG